MLLCLSVTYRWRPLPPTFRLISADPVSPLESRLHVWHCPIRRTAAPGGRISRFQQTMPTMCAQPTKTHFNKRPVQVEVGPKRRVTVRTFTQETRVHLSLKQSLTVHFLNHVGAQTHLKYETHTAQSLRPTSLRPGWFQRHVTHLPTHNLKQPKTQDVGAMTPFVSQFWFPFGNWCIAVAFPPFGLEGDVSLC